MGDRATSLSLESVSKQAIGKVDLNCISLCMHLYTPLEQYLPMKHFALGMNIWPLIPTKHVGWALCCLVERTPAKTGKLPGVTKEIQSFQITNKPRVYCLDSPGILLPK